MSLIGKMTRVELPDLPRTLPATPGKRWFIVGLAASGTAVLTAASEDGDVFTISVGGSLTLNAPLAADLAWGVGPVGKAVTITGDAAMKGVLLAMLAP